MIVARTARDEANVKTAGAAAFARTADKEALVKTAVDWQSNDYSFAQFV
jgi:hypothetical protein